MAQRQFRSDDTSSWTDKYGDGSDGAYSSGGNATDAPIDSSCSGTSGTTSLSATNASFAAGQLILIHQSRGTGVGQWELNKIDSYVAGTITTAYNLINTYTDSGASQAQVLVIKQYSSFTQNSGHTLTAKSWDGNVGGIMVFACNGDMSIVGGLAALGGVGSSSGVGSTGGGAVIGGFRGGYGRSGNDGQYARQGEGSVANGSESTSANGNGGGGALLTSNTPAGGGGGGNGGAGANGQLGISPGTGGATSGAASLITMVFGGGGGGGVRNTDDYAGGGGSGGGIIILIGKSITVTGTIKTNGGAGANSPSSDGDGGGGAGGSILLKSKDIVLGSSLVTATAGSGGGTGGGSGGAGRIHADYGSSISGTTSPTIDSRQDSSLLLNMGNFFALF